MATEHYEIETYHYTPLAFGDTTQSYFDAGAALVSGTYLVFTPGFYNIGGGPAYISAWQSGPIEDRPPLAGDATRTDTGWDVYVRLMAPAGYNWQFTVISTHTRNGTGSINFTSTGAWETLSQPLFRVIGLDVDDSFSSNVITRFQISEVDAIVDGHDNEGISLYLDWVELRTAPPVFNGSGPPFVDTMHRAHQSDEDVDFTP